jgi:hypothetical protein
MAAPAVAGHGHRVGAPPGAQPPGVYRPRRPRASPLYDLLDRRFRHLSLVYDERFAPTYGPWRPVVPTVVDRFLACGLLEHGFARIRCDACAHEYLLAFSYPRLAGQLASPSPPRRHRRRLPARRHLRALARLAGIR